jgi:chorismate mutase
MATVNEYRDEVPLEIVELRHSIDNMDAALVFLLAERFRLTGRVGQIKAEHGLPPKDPNREKRQTARLKQLAEEAGLDVEFAESFRAFVTAEVIRHHENYAKK